MGHLPLPASKGPGHHTPVPPPPPRSRIPQLEPVALLASLREGLGAARPPDTIFRAITDTARTVTGAEGVAIALRAGGMVVCRARSGNLGPEIGAELNAGSGISGECLRTSKTLRCDDTQTDDRVDPEVCRKVGIRSLAVVPLRGRDGTVGILEVFSPRANAFGAEQISFLKRLAEIAQTAYEAECSTTVPVPGPRVQAVNHSRIRPEVLAAANADTLAAATTEPDAKRIASERFGLRLPSARRYWITGAAVLLLLTMAVIWTTWQEPDEDGLSPQAAQAQTVPDEAASPAPPAVISWKPAAGWPASRTTQARPIRLPPPQGSTNPALQNAAEIETEKGGLSGQETSLAGAVTVVAEEETSTPQGSPDPPSVAESMPATEPGNTGEALARLVSAPTKLPEAEMSVSQGVSQTTLIHKVQPVYPAEARSQRLEGSVVLELTVGEDGSPQDLKVVSGPSVLARAATEAIRQWRYRPALLNGKPIVAQKQITVIFRAP
jgi:protein TonB